jgi:hypothetical protein
MGSTDTPRHCFWPSASTVGDVLVHWDANQDIAQRPVYGQYGDEFIADNKSIDYLRLRRLRIRFGLRFESALNTLNLMGVVGTGSSKYSKLLQKRLPTGRETSWPNVF